MLFRSRGFDAIALLVEAGMGVAVLPDAPARRFAQVFDVRRLTLDEAWAQRDYVLGVARQERLPTVVQRFVDALCPAAKAEAAAAQATNPPVSKGGSK